jgi:hypothetical protein
MNTRPTESEGFSRTYLVKGKTTTGYIYTPIALIGKRVRLQEVKIIDTGRWICPFCSVAMRVGQREKHLLKYHKGVAE